MGLVFFFFSSRRRHTRFSRDWSSDVCSSDLYQVGLHPLLVFFAVLTGARVAGIWGAIFGVPIVAVLAAMTSFYRAGHEERVARLQEELPGQELVSVDLTPVEAPDAELITSGKGVRTT